MKKLNEMVKAINEKGIKLVCYGDKSSFVTTDEKIEIEIVSMDKKFRLNHIIEVSNDGYVLHAKRKEKNKKKWDVFESKAFNTTDSVLNKIFNDVISGHCWYNGMYTFDLFDETLEDALEKFMEILKDNVDSDDIFQNSDADIYLCQNEITVDYTSWDEINKREHVEFNNEIVVDEETGERYVICWLPDSELFELVDLSLCMWNK
ncbi:TPA: hypothetical protein ACGXMA_002987 [Bacillus cereus]